MPGPLSLRYGGCVDLPLPAVIVACGGLGAAGALRAQGATWPRVASAAALVTAGLSGRVGSARLLAEASGVVWVIVALGVSARWPALRIPTILAAGAFDAALGLALGVAGAVLEAPSWGAGGSTPRNAPRSGVVGMPAWVAALAAGVVAAAWGTPARLGADVDLGDVFSLPGTRVAPWGAWPGTVALGLAVVGAVEARARRAALACWLVALGGWARWDGEIVAVLGRTLPGPGALLGVVQPPEGGVPARAGAAALVAVAVVAVAWARPVMAGRSARPAWAFAGVGLLAAGEAAWAGARAWPAAPPEPPPVVSAGEDWLSRRDGAVLVLPRAVEGVRLPEGASGASSGRLARTGRRAVAPPGSLPRCHALLGEPAVVGALVALSGDPSWLLPPVPAGGVLRALGVTDVVVERGAVPPAARPRLDAVLRALLGPPRRDVAGALDLYRVPAVGEVAPTPVCLRRAGDDGTARWRVVGDLFSR
jgi:hypothetical protein